MDTRIFCDESCHLQNDKSHVMVLGAVWGEIGVTREFTKQVSKIKAKHGFSGTFEIKWKKVSEGKGDFYQELLSAFMDHEGLNFRGVVISDKSKLDHDRFGQTHDDWYYKMYYQLLKPIISKGNSYEVFIDLKDTRSRGKVELLKDIICNKIGDYDGESLRLQSLHSDRSPLIQICDLLIGAVGYHNRGFKSNAGKTAFVTKLRTMTRLSLMQSTPLSHEKFNLFFWDPQGGA